MSFQEHHGDTLSIRMVLIGDPGVGKKALFAVWSENNSSDRPTQPFCYDTWLYGVVDCTAVDVLLWDVGSTMQWHPWDEPLRKPFGQTSVVILTVAIDDPTTFKSIDKWLKFVHEGCDGEPPVILAINKMDLKGDDCPVPNLRKDAEDVFAGVFYISLKTQENVQELFDFACRKGYESVIAEKG